METFGGRRSKVLNTEILALADVDTARQALSAGTQKQGIDVETRRTSCLAPLRW
jgi:hypothetical protein